MRKLKIFGIFCLLSYCTAFIAFAASTINQAPSSQLASGSVSETEFTAQSLLLAAGRASHINDTASLSSAITPPGTLPSAIAMSSAATIPFSENEQVTDTSLPTPAAANPAPVNPHASNPSVTMQAVAMQTAPRQVIPSLTMPLPSAAPLGNTAPPSKEKPNTQSNRAHEASLGLPLPCSKALAQYTAPVPSKNNANPTVLSGLRNLPGLTGIPGLPDISGSSIQNKEKSHQQARNLKQISSADRPVQFSLPLPRLVPDKNADFFPAAVYRTDPDVFHEAAQQLQSLTITPDISRLPQSGDYSSTSFTLPTPSGKTTMNTLSPASVQTSDKKKTVQLANGLQVVLQKDDRFPLVSLRLYVHAGSAYESPKEAGISHVLEHMVFKGSKNYGDGEIAREVERNGGYLNAFTSFDQTGYIVDLPSSTWEKGLLVLKEMAFLPNFTNDHLASEKEVIVAELKRGKDSPGNVLFTQMIDGMFAGSSYAHPIIGYEETIRSFTVQDLYDYHGRWYQPQAMTLVICGNIDLDVAEKLVSSHFGAFKNNQDIIPPLRKSRAHNEPVVDIQTGPWQKVRLTLAFPAPNLRDNKAIHLDLLTHIIGGDQTSPLFKKYKYDKRLVDSIAMQSYNFEESGLVFVMATLDPENIKPFWQELLTDMRQGFHFDEKDLARAQLALQDSFYRSRETLEGYASQIGHYNFYFSGETDAHNYLTTIATTDVAILNNLYTEIFKPQRAGIFAIVPDTLSPAAISLDPTSLATMSSNAVAPDMMPREGDAGSQNLGQPQNTMLGMKPDAKQDHRNKQAYKQSPGQKQSLANWLVSELSQQWPATSSSQQTATADKAGSGQEVIVLDNGCSLILIPDATLPYTSVTMLFDGGESLLSPETQGLGALTAGVLPRGTNTKDYNAIQTFLAERAASLKAFSNRQTFGLSFSSPSQYTHDLFSLVNEVIATPSFSAAETDRVKENLQAAIIRSEEQPISLAFRHLTAFLYPRHSYGFLQLGTPESIASFTHADAQAHWENQRAYPWTLSICGDFSKKEILDSIRQLPTPTKTMQPLPVPELTKDKELSLYLADREQAHLFLIFPIPGTNTPDEAGLELLTTILAGQSGLLFGELRDKQGLGYTVTAFPWKTKNAGALIFYIGTEPGSLEQAHAGFTGIIASLKSAPLDSPTLDRGKNILSGEYYRERQSLSARSSEGATLSALGLPLDFKRSLIDHSQELTAKDIQKIAQKYLDLEKPFTVKVLPQPTK